MPPRMTQRIRCIEMPFNSWVSDITGAKRMGFAIRSIEDSSPKPRSVQNTPECLGTTSSGITVMIFVTVPRPVHHYGCGETGILLAAWSLSLSARCSDQYAIALCDVGAPRQQFREGFNKILESFWNRQGLRDFVFTPGDKISKPSRSAFAYTAKLILGTS